jgi:hypothetical protein
MDIMVEMVVGEDMQMGDKGVDQGMDKRVDIHNFDSMTYQI